MQGLRTCAAAFGYPRVTDSGQKLRLFIRAAAKIGIGIGIGDRAIAHVVMALCLSPTLMGHLSAQAFSDDFNLGKLDTTKWTVATYHSPDSEPGVNNGV